MEDGGGWGDRDMGRPFVSFLTVLNILVGSVGKKFPGVLRRWQGEFAICNLRFAIGKEVWVRFVKKGGVRE